MDWSGPYIGVLAGYTAGQVVDNSQSQFFGFPLPSLTDYINLNGGTFGGLVGFNYQTSGIVVGVEADLADTAMSGFKDFPGNLSTDPYHTDVDTHWTGHLRARFGVPADKFLFFVAGGLAVTDLDYRYHWPPVMTDVYSSQAQYLGLSLGAGVEYAITPSILLRAEYLYDNYGSHSFVFDDPSISYHASDEVSLQTHTVRMALSYKF